MTEKKIKKIYKYRYIWNIFFYLFFYFISLFIYLFFIIIFRYAIAYLRTGSYAPGSVRGKKKWSEKVSTERFKNVTSCFVINLLNNKTIILLSLTEYRLILADSAYGLFG